MYCDNQFYEDLEDHEATCAVEQFTRESERGAYVEDSKGSLYDDDFFSSRKKPVLQESKQIIKKRFEPPRKHELPKKRLTKLADAKSSVNHGKYSYIHLT